MTGCQQYAVGFANDDSRDLGTSTESRPGYKIIKKFRDLSYPPALGLGVLDIHTDFITLECSAPFPYSASGVRP